MKQRKKERKNSRGAGDGNISSWELLLSIVGWDHLVMSPQGTWNETDLERDLLSPTI